ncbi:hypothetical protein OC844_005956 [Tilletia horrida]|nr:hypothetical protein OC844_005956 [Tilletia horrida]
MSRLDEREPALALADCSFDELVPAAPLRAESARPRGAGEHPPDASITSTAAARTTTLSLRDAGTELPSALLDRMPPSHASSLIYAPSSTLIVARAIHHDARSGPVLHLTFSSLMTHAGEEDDADGGGKNLPDASLRILLPAPAVDSIGLSVYPQDPPSTAHNNAEPRTLHVLLLTHGAQLFQLSIPLTSALLLGPGPHAGLSARTVQRRTQNLGATAGLAPAAGWAPDASASGFNAGLNAGSAAMALVLGSGSKGPPQRGKTATQVLFAHSGLMLVACEDGTLVKLEKNEGSRGTWRETFLKPTSFFNTLARLIPRSSTAVSHSRSGHGLGAAGTSTTQLPEPTASFEPTQILALDAFDSQTSYAVAFAISRDRKMRIWGLFAETCLHTVELPRRRPELNGLGAESGFGARAIARRALGLRAAGGGAESSSAVVPREGSVPPSSAGGSAAGGASPVRAPSEYSTATAAFQAGAVFGAAGLGAEDGVGGAGGRAGGATSGGASLPRILLEEAAAGSDFHLFALVFVPVPGPSPAHARAESFFILYGVKLSSEEAVQAVTPLWSCAAADEGEDQAVGMASVPALRDMRLVPRFASDARRGGADAAPQRRAEEDEDTQQGWTLWTAWNTLAGPEVRKTAVRLDINGKMLEPAAQPAAAPALTHEEIAGPIWTSIAAFPCPSAPSCSSSARARYSPLHTDDFKKGLARAVDLGSSGIADYFLDRLLEPGRFDIGSLAKAADWYEEGIKRLLRGQTLAVDGGAANAPSVDGEAGGDRSFDTVRLDGAAAEHTGALSALSGRSLNVQSVVARLVTLIGSHLRPQRDAATGAPLHENFQAQLVREWVKYVDRVEKEEDAARYLLGFVGPVVCIDDDDMDDEDMDQDEEAGGAARNLWALAKRDPVMVLANNRISVPIDELPVETLLRIAKVAAKDDLNDFTSAPGEDTSTDEIAATRRFSPEALQALAAALSPVEAITLAEHEEENDTSARIQRARLLASLTALGLSVPRSLCASAAESILDVVGTGADSEDRRQSLNDTIQEAWLAACELHDYDRIQAVEHEVRQAHIAANGDDHEAAYAELGPEALAHIAERQTQLKEEVSQSVARWVETHLFQSEAAIVGDEAEALDPVKAKLMEQALWLWADVLVGPPRDAGTFADEGRPQHGPVLGSLFGAVLAADGALRSLLARRRLAQALLVLLLSLQRSSIFLPETGVLDGAEDELDLFATVDEDEGVPARTSAGLIPSLPLLLSTTLSTLQRIEGVYRLACASPQTEIEPKSLLVAAEISKEPETEPLPLDGVEDQSFDRTLTRMKNLTVRSTRRTGKAAGAAPAAAATRPTLVRSLFSLVVQQRLIELPDVLGRGGERMGDIFARTDGQADDHDHGALDLEVRSDNVQADLTKQISIAAGALLSSAGALGLFLPSSIWKALHSSAGQDATGLADQAQGLVDGPEAAAEPRFETPQAQLARSIFNAGFPSSVLSYTSCFKKGESPAIAYLTARSLIALGNGQAAQEHIATVARAVRAAAGVRSRALRARADQLELRRQARNKRLSPDDWEHAEREPSAEGGMEPQIEEDNEEVAAHAEDVDAAGMELGGDRPEHAALLSILPPGVAEAIDRYSLISAVAIELLYRHFVDVLVDVDAPEQLIQVCVKALEASAEVEAIVLDEEQHGAYMSDPSMEPPSLVPVAGLWSTLFRAQLRLGRFAEAYTTLMRIPLRDLQVECLRSLVGVMCEQGQSPVLLGFTFPGLQNDVERELSFKARNSHPMAYPNYYNILHKYHVFRGDMKNAAASMYQLAQLLAKMHRQGDTVLGPNADPSENFLELAKLQAQSYLAALNDLALCEPKDAWFPNATGAGASVASQDLFEVAPDMEDVGDDLRASLADEADVLRSERYREGSASAKRRRLTAYVPEHMFQEERKPIHMICLPDIRREYQLVLARLQLVSFFPEAASPSFVLGPDNAVSLFVGNRQFDAAFATARELEVDMTTIFQRLTTICVALTDNLTARRNAESRGTEAFKRRLDSVADADENLAEPEVEFLIHSEWSANWDGPAADRAWDFLRIHLEMYDGPRTGWRYRQAVLDRCLALGAQVVLPLWLVQWFQTRKPDALMRSYINSGRIDEALREGIRIASDVSHATGPTTTYVPYSLIDTALLLAEDPEERVRRAASPSVLQTRDLAGELRTAVRKRFDMLAKAEKAWIRQADRAEREQHQSEQQQQQQRGSQAYFAGVGGMRKARGPGTASLQDARYGSGFAAGNNARFNDEEDTADLEDEDEVMQ